MSEDSYMIARIVAAVCILILVVPALLGRGITVPNFLRYAAMWALLAAGAAILYQITRG